MTTGASERARTERGQCEHVGVVPLSAVDAQRNASTPPGTSGPARLLPVGLDAGLAAALDLDELPIGSRLQTARVALEDGRTLSPASTAVTSASCDWCSSLATSASTSRRITAVNSTAPEWGSDSGCSIPLLNAGRITSSRSRP